MTKVGTGVQSISGTNTYNGGTSINAGTLQFGQTVSMPATGDVTVNSGGTLSVNSNGSGEWSESTNAAVGGTIGSLIAGRGGQGLANQVNWSPGSSLGIDTTNASGGAMEYTGVIGSFRSTILPGDYNHDGNVGAADYVAWRLGSSPTPNSVADYNTWRSNFGATAGGGTTDNVGFTKCGYGTLTLSGNNTFSGQLKVDNEGGTLRLTTAEPNAGQSMVLPTVSIGNSLNAIPTVLKTLTANAIPSNSVISFGSRDLAPCRRCNSTTMTPRVNPRSIKRFAALREEMEK